MLRAMIVEEKIKITLLKNKESHNQEVDQDHKATDIKINNKSIEIICKNLWNIKLLLIKIKIKTSINLEEKHLIRKIIVIKKTFFKIADKYILFNLIYIFFRYLLNYFI